eukprot:4822235-Amphidinium_carterae.2
MRDTTMYRRSQVSLIWPGIAAQAQHVVRTQHSRDSDIPESRACARQVPQEAWLGLADDATAMGFGRARVAVQTSMW